MKGEGRVYIICVHLRIIINHRMIIFSWTLVQLSISSKKNKIV